MYHADPADEGEPSSGFFYYISIPAIVLTLFLVSCHNFRQKAKIVEAIVFNDTSKPVVKAPPPPPEKPKKKKKKIYLTFDDGPNKGTKNVLDIVTQEDVPVPSLSSASMFLPV